MKDITDDKVREISHTELNMLKRLALEKTIYNTPLIKCFVHSLLASRERNKELEESLMWMPNFLSPEYAGWYYVHNKDDSLSIRYFDDTDESWWSYDSSSDVKTLVPNKSFKDWLFIRALATKAKEEGMTELEKDLQGDRI